MGVVLPADFPPDNAQQAPTLPLTVVPEILATVPFFLTPPGSWLLASDWFLTSSKYVPSLKSTPLSYVPQTFQGYETTPV